MKPDLLREHIRKTQAGSGQEFSFGVNIPLLRGDVEEIVRVCLDEGVKIVFTSAGNPALFTPRLKAAGAIVAHVVPSAKLAKKAEERGVDIVVCEGTEAGGHDGVDEIPTFVLVPQVCEAVKVPVIAAGGIVNGRGIAAALALGAEGVQIGTRFAATVESSASERFKQAVVAAGEADTVLTLKRVTPTRMIRNPFAIKVADMERRGATEEELRALLDDAKRERRGIFEGDWEEGQFEAGMGAGMIHDIPPVATVLQNLVSEYRQALRELCGRMEVGDARVTTPVEDGRQT